MKFAPVALSFLAILSRAAAQLGGHSVGDTVCVEGFVMDTYCIDLGVLLDNQSVRTLEEPFKHSVHCLLDVPPCVESPFNILMPPVEDGGDFSEGYYVTDNQLLIDYGKSVGKCSVCNDGDIQAGLRLMVTGIVQESVDGKHQLQPTEVMLSTDANAPYDCTKMGEMGVGEEAAAGDLPATCVDPASDADCPTDYTPVNCGPNACEYFNPCYAFSAGFTAESCGVEPPPVNEKPPGTPEEVPGGPPSDPPPCDSPPCDGPPPPGDDTSEGGAADLDPVECPEMAPDTVCTTQYDPVVCGPDGCEYSNLCAALAADWGASDCESAPDDTVVEPPVDISRNETSGERSLRGSTDVWW